MTPIKYVTEKFATEPNSSQASTYSTLLNNIKLSFQQALSNKSMHEQTINTYLTDISNKIAALSNKYNLVIKNNITSK